VGAEESPGTSLTPSSNKETHPADHETKQSTLREWSEVAAQLTATANVTSRMFERYIASLDGTMKELRPCMAVIERTLKKLDERLGPVVQPKPFAVRGPDTQPRVVPTPVTVTRQGTIIIYLVRKSENGTYREPRAQQTPPREALGSDGPDTPPRNVPTPGGHSPEKVDWGGTGELYRSPTRPTMNDKPSGPSDTEDTSDDDNINRESGAQPTPPDGTFSATGPDTPPADVLTLQGPVPERFDWPVDLRDNTYNYERLVETGGSAEHAGGRDTPFRTEPAALPPLPPISSRWSDELIGGRGALDRGRPATMEDTLYLGPADSPVSHNNVWDQAVTQPKGDTASSVYDGGGERVPDTPQDGNGKRSCVPQPKGNTSSSVYDGGGERIPETLPDVNNEKPKKYYMIHVDKLKLFTAATQSPNSVAILPTTH